MVAIIARAPTLQVTWNNDVEAHCAEHGNVHNIHIVTGRLSKCPLVLKIDVEKVQTQKKFHQITI